MSQTSRPAGLERGDHVYVRHPKRGPIAVKVLAAGRDGFTGTCEQGERHQVPYGDVLGHKTRLSTAYQVVDEGADGAIVQDGAGRRRYIGHGGRATPDAAADAGGKHEEQGGTASAVQADDPLTGRMDRLQKAETIMDDQTAAPRRVVLLAHPDSLLKAGPIANRPGLALKDITDSSGRRSKHWVRTTKDQSGARKPGQDEQSGARKPGQDEQPGGAPMKHGDVVQFRHGEVEGKGRIVGSGADGVTVHDGQREHQVRHEHLTGRAPEAEQAGPMTPPMEAGTAKGGEGGDNPAPLFQADQVAALPDKADQPTKNRAELYAKSGEALAHLQDWLNKGKGIASQLGYETMSGGMGKVDWDKPGGLLFIAPLKGEKRAAEKVASDYGGDWSKLRDVVRCSIAVDTLDDVKATLAALQKGGMKLAMKPKDRFHKPVPVGYRDLLLNVTMPNGIVSEVQLHVKAMLKAKEDGHKHYETERVLDSKVQQHGADSLSPEERGQLKQAQDQQKAIYGQAWKVAMAGGDAPGSVPMTGGETMAAGQPMAKAMRAGARYSFFDHEGAQFRRAEDGVSRGVHDVLTDGKWQPYRGSDHLLPALYGDEIGDPLAKSAGPAAGGEQIGADAAPTGMRKAMLFLKGGPAKRSLYVHRKVTNGADIAEHYRDQGCTHLMDPAEMHSTVCYSKQPCDWEAMGDGPPTMVVPASEEGRKTGSLGKEGAVVLHYASDAMQARHKEMRARGASSDYPDYKPHVTVSYKGAGFDRAKPWTGPIHLGPEVRREITGSYKPPTLAKSLWVMLKAAIHGPGQADMFGVPVTVQGYTTKKGVRVDAHTAIRHKAAPQPMSHEAAAAIADAAHQWHAERRRGQRNPPSASPAAVLGGYANAVGLKIHDDHEGLILDKMKEATDRAVAAIGSPAPPRLLIRRYATLPPAESPAVVALPAKTIDQNLSDMQMRRDPDQIKGAKHFYVSAIDGRRRHLLAGPYATHAEALAQVGNVSQKAEEGNPKAAFMAWGTAGSATPLKTPLGAAWTPEEPIMKGSTTGGPGQADKRQGKWPKSWGAFQPAEGDRVEFLSDRQTEKGPSTGRVTKVQRPPWGPTAGRATIAHSDHPGEEFDCDTVDVRSAKHINERPIPGREGGIQWDRTDWTLE